MQNTLLGTVEYKKITKSWQITYNNTSLENYTGNKAENRKWHKTNAVNKIGVQWRL